MTVSFNFDIESMLEDRVIRILEQVEGLEGITILRWDDETVENIYPLILVKAGPLQPLAGTGNRFIGDDITLNITVFTDKASDSEGRVANHLRGVVRYAMNSSTIAADLTDTDIGLHVYSTGVISQESVDATNGNDIQRGQLFRVVAQATEIA